MSEDDLASSRVLSWVAGILAVLVVAGLGWIMRAQWR